MPADPAGVRSIDKIDVARDGEQIVYGNASDLYIVDLLRSVWLTCFSSTTSELLSDAA